MAYSVHKVNEGLWCVTVWCNDIAILELHTTDRKTADRLAQSLDSGNELFLTLARYHIETSYPASWDVVGVCTRKRDTRRHIAKVSISAGYVVTDLANLKTTFPLFMKEAA